MKVKRYGVNVRETAFQQREKQSNLQIWRSPQGFQVHIGSLQIVKIEDFMNSNQFLLKCFIAAWREDFGREINGIYKEPARHTSSDSYV